MGEHKDQVVVVPDLGGHHHSKVIEVIVKEGDQVSVDQGLFTVESEKAAMEIPSPFAGQVTKILVKAGDTVSPGDALLHMHAEAAVHHEEVPAVQQSVQLVTPEVSNHQHTKRGGRAGPFVRRMAHEMGIDLSKVKGSGSSKQVTPKDIEAYLRGAAAEAPAYDMRHYTQYEKVEFDSAGAYTAKKLAQSWQSIPMVTHHCTIDITTLDQLRSAHKKQCEEMGGKLTLLPIIIKVMAKLLERHPVFNRVYIDHQCYGQLEESGIGFAVDTPNGLLVPVIRDVATKDIMSLSKEIKLLAQKAIAGELMTEQMQGGSTTVSSLGNLVGGFFTPLVNAPQASILGVTRASMMPSIHEGVVCARLMLPISLSYDHRLINGADAARWIVDLQAMVDEVSAVGDALLLYS